MKRAGKDDEPAWVINGEHIQRSRLRVDARKWLLAKMLPKVFGDRIAAELTGKDGAPLVPDVPARDVARAIADILRTAHIEGAVDDADQTGSNEDVPDLDEQPGPPIGGHVGAPARSEGAGAWGSQAPAAHARKPKTSFEPGESEALPNGASITMSAEFERYEVRDHGDQLLGFRRSLQDARALAAKAPLPPKETP
jgi:hypothetical protein